MSIKGQGHSLTLVKGHTDFKVKCLTFGLYTQVSNSGPHGPLVYVFSCLLYETRMDIIWPLGLGRVWEIAVHLAVACDVYDGVFLCCPFPHEMSWMRS